MIQTVQYNYSNARVLITGGSNGIGYACATAYRDAGAEVMITGRKDSARDYDNDLGGMSYHSVNVADRQQLEALAASLDKLDILVNNAGGTQPDEWSSAGFEQSLAVNLSSVFHLSNACKPLLADSDFPGGASIAAIASMTSYFGSAWTPGYGPAKAGLVQMIKTFAVSWGEDGIRANAVAAGLTQSNLTSPMIEHLPQAVEETLSRQAVKRLGQGNDIAAAVLFLTSPAASWISGQTLPVDGGFTVTM